MSTPSLLIYQPSYQRLGDQIAAISPDLSIITMDSDGQFLAGDESIPVERVAPEIAWMNIDIFQCPKRDRFIEVLLNAQSLSWVQTAAAGLDSPIFSQLIDNGVRLSNSDAQSPAIADFAVGSVLAHLQRYEHRRALQASRQWESFQFRELGQTRWLIVGYGSIGQEAARRVKAFGAHVTGIRRQPEADAFADEVATLDEVRAFLPRTDVVLLCCPLNDATHGLVDAEFLSAMKPDSVLVNVGRGGLVVESDLLDALGNDAPAHAILDVFKIEPLPRESPLWEHPKVMVSAHASAVGDGMGDRGDTLFLENLDRYLKGQPLYKEVVQAG